MTGDARSLPPADRIGLGLWIGIEGTSVTPDTVRLLSETRAGGIILFRRNIASLSGCRRLLRDLTDAAERPLLFSIDQEGGLVVRFDHELTVFPGNMALGAIAATDPDLACGLAREQGRISGCELAGLGFHVNLAPVLDLATSPWNPGIGLRSFGSDPDVAGALAAALIEGHAAAGIHTTAKHFPGKGEARVDAHLDLPRIDSSRAEHEVHLRPFRTAMDAGVGLVMTSHCLYGGLDPSGLPATLSRPLATDLLRGDLGFRGVCTTDDMEMSAMTRHFGFAESIRGAALAGHDVVYVCHTPSRQREAYAVLRDLVDTGAMSEAELDRRNLRILGLREATAGPGREDGAAGRSPAGTALAERVASRAVTIVRDDRRLLPLDAGAGPVGILFPESPAETMVEDLLRGADRNELLAPLLALPGGAGVHFVPATPGDEAIARAVEFARTCRTVIACIADAIFHEARSRLACSLAAAHDRVVFVLLRSPFDDIALAPSGPRTIVTGYGFRPCHLQAVASVLRGAAPAEGRLPVALPA